MHWPGSPGAWGHRGGDEGLGPCAPQEAGCGGGGLLLGRLAQSHRQCFQGPREGTGLWSQSGPNVTPPCRSLLGPPRLLPSSLQGAGTLATLPGGFPGAYPPSAPTLEPLPAPTNLLHPTGQGEARTLPMPFTLADSFVGRDLISSFCVPSAQSRGGAWGHDTPAPVLSVSSQRVETQSHPANAPLPTAA